VHTEYTPVIFIGALKMKMRIFCLILSLAVVISLISLSCNAPNDPTDSSKTLITAVFKNTDSVVSGNSFVDTVGKPLSIGAALFLPQNFDSISLLIKENDVVTLDTTFKSFKEETFFDTVWCTRTFTTEGIKNVTLTPFSSPSLQQLSVSIQIIARPGAPVHISFIKNATSVTGTMPIKTCTSGEILNLPENAYINPGYRFSGWATTATGSILYRDKDEIKLGIEDIFLYAVWVDQSSIAPIVVHAPSQLIAGKADTLLFSVDNSSRPDPLTIKLITAPPLDPAVFSIVPTGPDSIKIAIAQSAHSATANIGIVTSNGTKSDTSWYPITIISPEVALWNTATLDLNAVEGLLFKLDLSQYLSSVSSADVSLSADIGIIDSTTWSYIPKWGCATELPAIITAKKGDVSLTLSLNLSVTAGDTAKPQLTLVDTSFDGKKVSASQITVECKAIDTGAGVDSVVFTYGTQKITATLQGEGVYSGVVTGLVYNTPTKITITATDKSRLKNSATLTFTVTSDSTLLDAEPPVIVKTAGPESGARVKSSKDTLTFTVNDNAGVDSVWWTLNDTFVAAVSPSDKKEYSLTYTFSDFGKNTIKLYAKDGSGAGNMGSQTIILNYNTEPTAITLIAPAANVTGVSTSPTFKWSGGDDADGDVVTFTINYGISQASLSNTATVTGKTATLSSPLVYAKTYYWQATAASASTTYPDTVQSSVGLFSTEGSLPTISTQPLSQSVEEGQSVTFSVIASGFGTLSYQWRENGTAITGATTASYKIISVTTSMNNNSYDCVVNNEVGEVPSNAAKLTVTSIPTFIVSFVTDGGLPKPDNQTVIRGGKATAPLSNPVRSGYRFTGWYELNATNEFNFTQTVIAADLIIYAGWKKVYTVTYHKNSDEGGSVPTGPVYDSGAVVTVVGNTGNLSKTDYEFKGWTITPDGSGAAITSISATSNIELYPKWTQVFVVTFDGQGATTAPSPTIITVSSPANTVGSLPTDPKKRGYSFVGWTTSAGTSFIATTTVAVSMTVFANWEIRDNEGNTYGETIINGKVWMNKNYQSSKLNDGKPITSVQNVTDWTNGDPVNKPCYYAGFCGVFYNDLTIKSGKLAPDGWRLPTSSELGLAAGSFSSVCCMGSLQISYMDGAVIYGSGTSASYWSSTMGTNGGHIFRAANCSTGVSEEIVGAQDNNGCSIRLIRDY
jgi:uncharacterized repeat protein (TIGR02543 family)